ncbi:MAG: phosphodiester glycosidase family protein [Christensenellaceae bacterium]|nr:phosphodiester glycosidase family protein [Christensenellaceae bacterium]
MKARRAALLWYICFACLLVGFTLYVLLDAFVIERRYRAVLPQKTVPPSREAVLTDTSYQDESLTITLSEHRYLDSTVHLAEIVLTEPTRLQTALARDTFGRNITERVADTALRHGAILAVNGDYYGSQQTGYVLRNGVIYRDTVRSEDQEDLVCWQDGSMSVVREGEVSAQSLLDAGAWQVFSFGPALVRDGEVAVGRHAEVGNAMASNPRTAIGMIGPSHYLVAVADGRTEESAGLSLYELASFLREQGAQLAYNLDGGGSSTMIFDSRVVNFPTTRGWYNERAVSDIVYFR